jgi:hypothetical protein
VGLTHAVYLRNWPHPFEMMEKYLSWLPVLFCHHQWSDRAFSQRISFLNGTLNWLGWAHSPLVGSRRLSGGVVRSQCVLCRDKPFSMASSQLGHLGLSTWAHSPGGRKDRCLVLTTIPRTLPWYP